MEYGTIEREIHVQASPEVAFAVVSQPEHLREWWPDDASGEAVVGAPGELIWRDQGTGRTESVAYTVVVKASNNAAPTGTVTVTDNGKEVATANVTADANGTVTITIPGLKRGVHMLVAKFAGDGYASSSSRPDVVVAR